MNLFKFIPLVMILAVTACSFRKDDVKQQEAAKATNEVLTTYERNQEVKKQSEEDGGKLTDENVKVQFIEDERPGSYKLRVSWPESVVTMAVQVDENFDLHTTRESFLELPALHDQEYKIRLFSKNSMGLEVDRKEIIVKAPCDVILEKNISLSRNTSINCNRVYFFNGTQIQTNGYDIALDAKKLYVISKSIDEDKLGIGYLNESHIITTLPNSIAKSPNQLEGSKIMINAEEAHGTLKIAMIGLNGRNGRNGDELDQERGLVRTLNAALNGANGQNSFIGKETVPCPGRRGSELGCERTVPTCDEAPTNGTDGKQGLAGTPGEDGERGGNTGSFFIDIKRPGTFKVEVGQLAGKPGRGGIGGAGSPGGLPGKAGKQEYPCPAAVDGKPGAQGPQGANGANGKDGLIGTVHTGAIPAHIFPL